MQRSLTKGPITSSILLFALPLMLGNLLQQMYNIADTWVVGRFLGADALAAVGSSYTLMTVLTSILLGLCMGSGAAISMQYGSGEQDRMRQSVFLSFVLIAGISLVLNVLVYLGLDGILWVLVCTFAAPLMGIFIDPGEGAIIAAGVHYLRIEGACYIGIGILFLLYGYYRAVNQPQMSVVLTIASLGSRVALAYLLSATPLGVTGIWLSVPIGWALADIIGIGYYLKKKR